MNNQLVIMIKLKVCRIFALHKNTHTALRKTLELESFFEMVELISDGMRMLFKNKRWSGPKSRTWLCPIFRTWLAEKQEEEYKQLQSVTSFTKKQKSVALNEFIVIKTLYSTKIIKWYFH